MLCVRIEPLQAPSLESKITSDAQSALQNCSAWAQFKTKLLMGIAGGMAYTNELAKHLLLGCGVRILLYCPVNRATSSTRWHSCALLPKCIPLNLMNTHAREDGQSS